MSYHIEHYSCINPKSKEEETLYSLISFIHEDPETAIKSYKAKRPSLIVEKEGKSWKGIVYRDKNPLVFVISKIRAKIRARKNEETLLWLTGFERKTIEELYRDFKELTDIKELNIPVSELKNISKKSIEIALSHA